MRDWMPHSESSVRGARKIGYVDAAPTPSLIMVDSRELDSELVALLARRDDVALWCERLPVGDYRVENGIVVERKTAADLGASFGDGRIFAQAAALKRADVRPLLLVEERGQSPPRRWRSALQTLSAMWYLPVLWTRGPPESADLLVRLSRAWLRDTREHWLRPRRARPDDDARRLAFLCGIPGVGPGRARRLLRAFGSAAGACRATREELRRVEGIGPKCADRMRAFLDDDDGASRVREPLYAFRSSPVCRLS